MNFRTLSSEALSNFATNVATLLGGTELSAIDSNVRADLATAIGTLPDTLATKAADVATADGTNKAAVSSRNETRADVVALMSQVRKALGAGLAPKEQYDLCGFDYPLIPASAFIPQDPTELAVAGFSNGVNKGTFRGNNPSGRVSYEVWRRVGDTGAWSMIRHTRKQKFQDSPVTPGQYYEYKVRASAARADSNFSNSSVVYGAV